MTKKQVKNTSNNKLIDSIVARVSGATQVAGAAVSETMAIKNKAFDEINALQSTSSNKKENQAKKEIIEDTKNLKK